MRYLSSASALTLLTSVCSVLAQEATPTTSAPDLAQTCQHKPRWQVCQGYDASSNLECATIKVSRDWTPSKNDGSEIYMRLIRYKALNNPDTANSIVINPGGPGESGIQFVAKGGSSLAEIAGYNYHIVGFDPRGVGQNMPYNCDAKVSYPSESDVYQSYADGFKGYAQQCYNDVDKSLGSIINTIQSAKDVVAISEAVNADSLIRYWGFSYGTLLGNVIARVAPSRIERMILDGNIDPNAYYYTNTLAKATDSDRAVQQFFNLCAQAGAANCGWRAPAGQDFTYENLITKFNNWVGAQPGATNRGRTDANNLDDTQSLWVRYNLFRGIYAASLFPKLAQILQYWYDNKGQIPNSLVNFQTYIPSGIDAPFKLNATRVVRRQTGVDPDYNPSTTFAMAGNINGISCVDTQFHPDSSSDTYKNLFAAYDQKSVYAGDLIRGGDATCIPWIFRPGEAWNNPDVWAANGNKINTKKPILFVQTTFDPVTPLVMGQAAKSYYNGAVLVSTNGEGHCSSAHTSQTLNVAIRQYWNDGTLPPDGNIYGVVNTNPFTGPAQTSNFADGQGSAVQPDNSQSSSTTSEQPSSVQPDDASLGEDFIALRGADMSYLFDGLHVPTKRSPNVDRLFEGLHYTKRDVDTDLEYGVCSEEPTTSTTGTSKPTGATDTYSSWATWSKWTTTTTPAVSTWKTWDPKPTTWGTWAQKTNGWEAWTSQDGNVPVTKTISGTTTVVAIPTTIIYIDYVQDVCETGITTKVITVTATCAGGCESKPTGCPPGYTTTSVYCSTCATPSTVIVTVKATNWSAVSTITVQSLTWSAVPAVPATSVKSAEWSPATGLPVKPTAAETWSAVGQYTGAAPTISVACGSFIAVVVAAIWAL